MLKRLIKNLATQVQQRVNSSDAGFIDVKRLIADLSDEDLMRSADAYFASMTPRSEQCRKPFSNPAESVHLTRHLSLLLEAADLFRGARVLDMGCGTGWLTLALAAMGCDAVGVDIAPSALKLAEALKDARGPAQSGAAEFRLHDGHRLPLDDESVDRIVCFDAFHHVRDQRATLAEFARVLKNGGRAAFLEPGPNHSRTPKSQAEMAQFQVIENDVSMPDVARFAVEVGLDKPQMLVQFQQPFTVPVDDFNGWARGGVPKDWSARLIDALGDQLTNEQCFFVCKGQPTRDSRRGDGLAAAIELVSAQRAPMTKGMGVRVELRVRNTGNRDWITAAGAGQVNVGVHMLTPEGKLVDNNFARIRLPSGPVLPGQEVVVSGTIREPAAEGYVLRFDMVAELVAWFTDLGRTQPVRLASTDL